MIGKIPHDFTLNFDSSNISPSKQVKILSITLDQSLTIELQVDNISSRKTNAVPRINRVKHLLNKFLRQIPVNSLALSYLNYCTIIQGLCKKYILVKAEWCQNFAIKVIRVGHYKKYNSVTPLRIDLNLLTFWKLCELKLACHTCRTLIQAEKQLIYPQFQKSSRKRTIFYPAPTLWNNIPIEIRQKVTISSFKTHLTKYL